MNNAIDLTGRVASCYCHKEKPSSYDLAFFKFRGHGSEDAIHACKNCRYQDVAHTDEVRAKHGPLGPICGKFEPNGAFPQDEFYCGCDGWD